ncbi:nuclease [Flavobacterium album]|uniref:Nuclease n=1 Tax=Flavobacterium album TaxID=2175091 RepID=A0A2S1QY99_9FLAO|nr:nuclease [Flavobacterium album]AWH85397.1 nuclease [Flavobacterium album]
MNKDFKTPPKSIKMLTSSESLVDYFSELVGTPFILTGRTRTDGSNIRKLVASILEKHPLPELAKVEQFEIVPPRGKGVPKIVIEFIDTYIVTSGTSYNLQVWNRIPAAESLLIKYESGESLKCTNVRFVFVRIDTIKSIIASVIILTPEYIENRFGKFGKPTIKHQLLISGKVRKEIYARKDKILSFPDSKKLSYYIRHEYIAPKSGMVEEPDIKHLFSIALLKKMVAEELIGFKLDAASTKNRGQALEKKVLELLGYEIKESDLLYGAFPDIRNQLLEVKVQDSPTVDLGKFSPEKEEIVIDESRLTTFDVRYLIALTNRETEIIEGIILAPGEKLGELFSYVSAESYKCQRTIPMAFFDNYYGKSVFNPD